MFILTCPWRDKDIRQSDLSRTSPHWYSSMRTPNGTDLYYYAERQSKVISDLAYHIWRASGSVDFLGITKVGLGP